MVYSPWNLHSRLTVPVGWCPTSVAGPAAPPAPAMTSLVRTSTLIYRMPIAAQQATDLESSSWLWNTPCQPEWSPGWDWLLTQQWLCCPEWLRVGQDRYPGPWFIWLQLRTWVTSWASSQHGRLASGPGQKNSKRQNKLGRSKTWAELEPHPGNFPRLKLVTT